MAEWNSDPRHPRQENYSQSGTGVVDSPAGEGQGPYDTEGAGLARGRGDLILTLGIVSLFLCGPLGIVAWVMANSDLRKMAEGRMSRAKIGKVKVGRALGIVGTAIFVVSVALLVHYLPARIPTSRDFLGPRPLPPDQIVFAGLWFGDKGTLIRIRVDGRGDFRSGTTSISGGRVLLEGDSLSIGIMGLGKTWNIDRSPYLEDGHWRMELDGETFTRQLSGLLVHIRTEGPGC